jgi:membrane-anchored protein YejM (alkaline phosphatase superfamily)
MVIDFPADKCKTPNINTQNLTDYKDLVDTLVQSILAGENPIVDETYGDWRIHIESIAQELSENIYEANR